MEYAKKANVTLYTHNDDPGNVDITYSVMKWLLLYIRHSYQWNNNPYYYQATRDPVHMLATIMGSKI